MAASRRAAAVALVALGCAAALSLARVFATATFALPVMGAVIAATVLGRISDARRWSPLVNELATVAALVVYLALIVEPRATWYGLPSPHTLAVLGHDLRTGLTALRTAVPPTDVTPGLLLLAVGGTWICAHTAEWMAFRVGSTIQALMPPFALFLVSAALGVPRHRTITTLTFVVGALVFVLLQSGELLARGASWLSVANRRPRALEVAAAGLPLVLVATTAAMVVGPRVPGARAAALLDWKGVSRGNPARQTISPLVDMKPRLTRSPDIELFNVRADAPAYWRLTALDAFDGRTWTSVGTYRVARGRLPTDAGRQVASITDTQSFTIEGLDSFWLPAAFRPSRISLSGARVHPDSLTLLTDRDTAKGLRYTVQSKIAQPTADALNALPNTTDTSFDRYRALPVDFPPDIRALALTVTARANTPYQKARALQDFFRTRFRYDENVAPGHSDDHLRVFLLRTRRGYCEQFSGAFAAMARAVGLPSRVAVGFTPGEFDPNDRVYRVHSSNAHAWPEVYLAGAGWTAFEPTPGRFEPTPSNYTGTFDAAALAGGSPAATTTTAAGNPATPTTRAQAPSERPDAAPPVVRHHRPVWPIVLIAVLMVLAGSYVAIVAGGKARRRARRRQRSDPRRRVAGAWQEVVERLDEARLAQPGGVTPHERARRVGQVLPTAAAAVERLGALYTRAAYRPAPPSAAEADAAWEAADAVLRSLAATGTIRERWRRRLDPRPLRPPPGEVPARRRAA
jgi:transglutaminase-like putative cysteine protease